MEDASPEILNGVQPFLIQITRTRSSMSGLTLQLDISQLLETILVLIMTIEKNGGKILTR